MFVVISRENKLDMCDVATNKPAHNNSKVRLSHGRNLSSIHHSITDLILNNVQ
jgi:hypothetical protein